MGESPASMAALRHAVVEARRAKCVLMPVAAWEIPGGEIAYYQCPVPELLSEWHCLARKRIDTSFEEAFGGYPSDLRIQPIAPRTSAGRALVELTNSDDLLVVGAGRRNWIRRLLRASVSHYCLAHAKCPVIAVPPPELLGELRFTARTFRRIRVCDTSGLTVARDQRS
ncbi:universal stress protein [Streptomyces kronopolitis]|uniref:universal stress protein n=1 Tax=Streptomyces kronopolitis TaxID=1612435 RepID=UPI0036873BEF